MREILFRGKNAKGEWEYGVPLITGLNSEIAYITQANSYDCRVDIDTIGQYTGLIDKNGKKIFEGDIMPVWENGEKYHYKVIYNGDCFMLSMLDSEQGSYPLSVKNSISEIIGNIHDNPELLESEVAKRREDIEKSPVDSLTPSVTDSKRRTK